MEPRCLSRTFNFKHVSYLEIPINATLCFHSTHHPSLTLPQLKKYICKILRGGAIMLHFGVNSFVASFKYNVVSNALEH